MKNRLLFLLSLGLLIGCTEKSDPIIITADNFHQSVDKVGQIMVHDIFSPKDYRKQWLQDEVRFWNEQYLLEAFLSHNSSWKIVGALNYLHHNHYDRFRSVAPFLTSEREPGSFYIQKII